MRVVSTQILNLQTNNQSVSDKDSIDELDGWAVSIASGWEDRKKLHRLRAEVYDQELGWACANNGYEVDIYDAYSTHLIVKSPEGEIVATARVVDWQGPWMATECYSLLFFEESQRFKIPSVDEVSRLCVDSRYRCQQIRIGVTVMDLLLQGILTYGLSRGKQLSYFITRAGMEKVLRRRRFEVAHMSERFVMPDGCAIRSFLVVNQDSLERFRLAG